MIKRRTHFFKITLRTVAGLSALFLAILALFGKALAARHLEGMTDCVFAVMALATVSFLLFSFLPYFQGDKRWYTISALLTAVFFISAVMVWQVSPMGAVIV